MDMFKEIYFQVKSFLSSVVLRRVSTVDDYFKSIERIAETEEERNKEVEKRIELKKKEFELKQRVTDARKHRKKLMELLGEYDPAASKRQRMKWMAIGIFGFALLMFMFKSCAC